MFDGFAEVASGENFRPTGTERLRHRLHRKGKYMLERWGAPGCVGCGRCIHACLVDIASPVYAWNRLAKEAAGMVTLSRRLKRGLFVPRFAVVETKEEMTASEVLLGCAARGRSSPGHAPGQFIQLSIFGTGRADLRRFVPYAGPFLRAGGPGRGSVTDAITGWRPATSSASAAPSATASPSRSLRDGPSVRGGRPRVLPFALDSPVRNGQAGGVRVAHAALRLRGAGRAALPR